MAHPERGEARRCAALGALILILALFLAACGGGGPAGDGEEADGEEGGESSVVGGAAGGTTGAGSTSAERYVLPGDQVFPEGITYQPDTGDFFVSSTTDGTIFRGDVTDTGGEVEVFLQPGEDSRTTAVGVRVAEGNRLFIAGGDTGRMFVYDTASGELVGAPETPESEMTFINDVAVTPNGDAYFTDSMRPTLFRVSTSQDGVGEAESWLELDGTPIEYGEGFNLNGIVTTEDGRYLITVQSNTGNLYRIDTGSQEVTQIDLGGETLNGGDGMALDGRTLYVVRGQDGEISPVELSEDFTSGEVGEAFSDPSFARPTTIALHDGRLLVVNSQFDRRNAGEDPDLPFTVSSIELPPSAP